MSEPRRFPADAHAFLMANVLPRVPGGHGVRTFLFSVRADGSPTVHPMNGYYRPDEGLMTFNTYGKSAKAYNLRRGEKEEATCLSTTKWDEPAFRGLVIRGRTMRAPAPAPSKRVIISVSPDSVDFLEKVR